MPRLPALLVGEDTPVGAQLLETLAIKVWRLERVHGEKDDVRAFIEQSPDAIFIHRWLHIQDISRPAKPIPIAETLVSLLPPPKLRPDEARGALHIRMASIKGSSLAL